MEQNSSYSASIRFGSREFTARERIILKDRSNAHKLDELCADGAKVEIMVQDYAIVAIHNEKSENPDYENLIIVQPDGEKFVTGSPSFIRAFMDIAAELEEEAEEGFPVCAYKLDSKNYKGKQFLTCSLV